MAGRVIGIVKWFDNDEGCGYIARKQGEDVYVHYSAIMCHNGDRTLKEGNPVEFTIVHGDNGPQAQDVIIIK